mgnify:FL=1|jgi:hypothetical protein
MDTQYELANKQKKKVEHMEHLVDAQTPKFDKEELKDSIMVDKMDQSDKADEANKWRQAFTE